MNTKVIRGLLLTCLLLGCSGLALGDATGLPGVWTLTNTGTSSNGTPDGFVVLGAGSINLYGGDNGTPGNTPVPGNTDYTTWINAPALVSFDWYYTTADYGPTYDPAFYLVIGGQEFLIGEMAPTLQGIAPPAPHPHMEVEVSESYNFGFRIYTVDGLSGRGELLINNFNVKPLETPSPVPEPVSMVLLGSGLGLGGVFRRRIGC